MEQCRARTANLTYTTRKTVVNSQEETNAEHYRLQNITVATVVASLLITTLLRRVPLRLSRL